MYNKILPANIIAIYVTVRIILWTNSIIIPHF